MTVSLYDFNDVPVGRATLPEGERTPTVILWNDRAYLYQDENASGKRYRQIPAYEIKPHLLRRAPGLASTE